MDPDTDTVSRDFWGKKMAVKQSSFALEALCLFFFEALMTEFPKNQHLAAVQR